MVGVVPYELDTSMRDSYLELWRELQVQPQE